MINMLDHIWSHENWKHKLMANIVNPYFITCNTSNCIHNYIYMTWVKYLYTYIFMKSACCTNLTAYTVTRGQPRTGNKINSRRTTIRCFTRFQINSSQICNIVHALKLKLFHQLKTDITDKFVKLCSGPRVWAAIKIKLGIVKHDAVKWLCILQAEMQTCSFFSRNERN